MSFFKKFGSIQYNIEGFNKQACDIITAAIVKHMYVDQSFVFYQYVVPDGATPESVSNTLYGDPHLYWTILLINKIIDPYTEWAISSDALEEWIVAKYGKLDFVIGFKHLDTLKWIDDVDSKKYFKMLENGESLPYWVTPVSALEYETELNNEKRKITVIAKRYISAFVDQFEKAIEGQNQ